jgi:hypothetical protein
MDRLDRLVADVILGIDTLWGGDVMCPSGTGRFIADSWFSDEPPSVAYSHPAAARVRETGGVGAKAPDREAIQAYVAAVGLGETVAAFRAEAGTVPGLRGASLQGLAECFHTMWDLGQEIVGRGEPVPTSARCAPRRAARSLRPGHEAQAGGGASTASAILAERRRASGRRGGLAR